jgi:hypothetical protein
MPKNPGEKEDPLDRFGVTLSGLLNVLDGFSAPENVLFFMTSNQIEMLDPALLRPGRIDYRLYLGKATEEQKTELYRRFFPQASMFDAQWFVEGHPETETDGRVPGLGPRAGGGSRKRLDHPPAPVAGVTACCGVRTNM